MRQNIGRKDERREKEEKRGGVSEETSVGRKEEDKEKDKERVSYR